MENIVLEAWSLFGVYLLGLIVFTVGGYKLGHNAGYDKGKRDERIKQYKELQNKKATFIDAD